jgi:3-hydroxybutyryl-CoA dehydrogenase
MSLSMSEIKNIAVIGSGTMGSGIAHVLAAKNFNVSLIDKESSALKKALATIDSNLNRQIKKGIILVENKESTLNNINIIAGVENISKDTHFVIEAIFENKEAKKSVYKIIDDRLSPDIIFATNTSSISITELAPRNRAERFIGMHFMNPVPVMKLVEIIRGHDTSQDTLDITNELTTKLDKVPVVVEDYPGFISNRILMPMINEAIFALYEGVTTKESIDEIMKLGMAHPMGPLTLADFIGLDVCLNILEVLYEGFGDPKYRACPLLKKMVAANKLGRKTGIGFYQYTT